MAGASGQFDRDLEQIQVEWRKTHVQTRSYGRHAGREREWILPADAWEAGLWPGIRTGAPDSLPQYLDDHSIQRHTGSNNLKSSWILCANLYFPFRATASGRALLAGFLRENVAPEIETVDRVELEFAADGELSPASLLGETGGSRGSGQTSPDVAFLVNGGRGIVLTESKLGEHSFYPCSARTTKDTERRPANPDLARCKNAVRVLDDAEGQCHQATWGRRYFSHLAQVANRTEWAKLPSCPAADTGYQFLRQQALAEGLAAPGRFGLVVSCVAYDARNAVLAGSLSALGLPQIADWARLFNGRARFRTFTHQH